MSASARVVIQRPLSSVFEFVLNGANNRLWKRSVLEARPLGEPPYGVGSAFHQELRGPHQALPADYRITRYEQNELLETEVIGGPVRWAGRYEFSASAAGTAVTYALQAQPRQQDVAAARLLLGDLAEALGDEHLSAEPLSAPERRAVVMRVDGKEDRLIARALFVGEGTARNYVWSGLGKLMGPAIQRVLEDEAASLDELKSFLEKII